MKTAAVIIDSWKLPIFSKHLRDASFSYDTAPGMTVNTITLKVAYEWVAKLQQVIEAAQKECADKRAANGAGGLS